MSRPYGDAAQAYWRAGWANPIPVKGKDQPVSGYTGYEGRNVSWPDVQAWLEGDEASHNIALRLPGDIVGIDVDAYGGKVGDASLAAAEAELGPLPESAKSTSRPPFMPSGIRFYRVPLDANLRGAEKRFAKRFGDHIDIIRRDHRYAITWPSVHPETGWTYRWYSPEGGECEIPRPADLPELPAAWLDFLIVAGTTEPSAEPTTEGEPRQESLWDQFAARRFTREQAREFVQPHLEALRAAPNGTINNRLNDAAIALAHFIPNFIPRAEAARYLLDALNETVYDGKTWRAEVTIASAFGAKTWQADLVDEAAAVLDVRAETLAREVARLHLQAEAREIFAAEHHARSWAIPADVGNLATWLQQPRRETQYRIAKMLGVGHNATIVAQRKAGKTTLVDNLIRSYVDDALFLNRFEMTATGRNVAIFNYEVEAEQYRDWLRETGITNTTRVHPLNLRGDRLPLTNPQVQTWVIRWLAERDIGLWIIDPYSRAYVGSVDNGNDESQVGRFLDAIDVIKNSAGVDESVMGVHTPKAEAEAGHETSIGSQRLEAWPDAIWYMVRDRETGVRYLRAEGRDVDLSECQLNYDVGTRTLALDLASGTRMQTRTKAEVLALVEYIQAHPGCSGRDIREGLGWRGDRLDKVRQAGRAAGLVRWTDPGRGQAQIYALIDTDGTDDD